MGAEGMQGLYQTISEEQARSEGEVPTSPFLHFNLHYGPEFEKSTFNNLIS